MIDYKAERHKYVIDEKRNRLVEDYKVNEEYCSIECKEKTETYRKNLSTTLPQTRNIL
jgi:hypothetical protein